MSAAVILDEAKGVKLIEWPSYLYPSYQIIFVQDVGWNRDKFLELYRFGNTLFLTN